MRKLFLLFWAVACCSMSFGQIISVTDGTLADWDNVPSEYLFKTECAPNASMDGLKSVQVYVDKTYINLLVEVNDQVVTDREWTPFQVYINSDNSAETGGFGDQWITADVDIMCETAIFMSGENYPYNPAVFKWWGANGENGWWWTDPNSEPNSENCWGAIVCEGSLPLGNSQMVEDGKIEIQLDYTLIPMPFDPTTFTLGFDILQSWEAVGVLPNAPDDELGYSVRAEKLLVKIHNVNDRTNIDGLWYQITDTESHTVAVVWETEPSDEISSYSNLTEANIPSSVTIDDISYSVTSIAYYAFYHCKQLTSVTIPNTVTSIGEGAFDGCESITSLNIPNSVTNIGEAAFAWCTGLTSVTAPAIFFEIPEIDWIKYTKSLSNVEVTSGWLADNALEFIKRSQKSLKELNLTAITNTTFADKAFEGCYVLDSIYFPSQLTAIPYMAMAECVNLKSITMPATVEYIDSRAFENCRLLSEVNFAENGALTKIGNWAFYNCHELKEIAIPEGVTSIGYAAFYGCTYLKELTLPASMQSVADNGFALCEKLEKMNINALLPPVVDARTFENVNRAIPVFVPADAVAQYKAAPVWQEFNIQSKDNVESDLENIGSDNGYGVMGNGKILRNGQLIIIRDGVEYNTLGQAL